MQRVTSPVKKRRQGKPLKSGEKKIVLYAFNQCFEKQPTLTIIQVAEMTSKVYRYFGIKYFAHTEREAEYGKLTTPGKRENERKEFLVTVMNL